MRYIIFRYFKREICYLLVKKMLSCKIICKMLIKQIYLVICRKSL